MSQVKNLVHRWHIKVMQITFQAAFDSKCILLEWSLPKAVPLLFVIMTIVQLKEGVLSLHKHPPSTAHSKQNN